MKKKNLKFLLKSYKKIWYFSQETETTIGFYLSKWNLLFSNCLEKEAFFDDLKSAAKAPSSKRKII